MPLSFCKSSQRLLTLIHGRGLITTVCHFPTFENLSVIPKSQPQLISRRIGVAEGFSRIVFAKNPIVLADSRLKLCAHDLGARDRSTVFRPHRPLALVLAGEPRGTPSIACRRGGRLLQQSGRHGSHPARATPPARDQQSSSLLADSHDLLDETRLFALAAAPRSAWECHGKTEARDEP